MLRCREISEQASDHIDGRLSAGARMQMAMHLLMCGRCRSFMRQMRLTVAALRARDEESLSAGRAAELASAAMVASRISDEKED